MATLRDAIASILDIPNTQDWRIVDAEPQSGLYLIHYASDASMVKYGSLKGVVVDVPNKAIVARSSGFMPSILASSLDVAEYDNKIHVRDATNPNVEYEIDPETTVFYPGFEGVLLRIFLHDGKVYYSTETKLNSPILLDLYKGLGGPLDLFDSTQRYSPTVHLFIVAHPDLQVASKTLVGPGYLVYIGARRMWETEDDDVENEIAGVDTFTPDPESPVTYIPSPLTLKEANKYLHFGFHDPFEPINLEERLLPGEFVLAYLYSPNGEITGTFRIESPSYHWRSSLRTHSNLYYQFYLLSNGKFIQTQDDGEREAYLRKFPILTPYDEKEIGEMLESGYIIVWPQEPINEEVTEQVLANKQSRLYNIFLAYLASLSPYLQRDALDVYQAYQKSLSDAKEWLIELNKKDDLDYELIPSRARRLITLARGFVSNRIEEGSSDESFDTLMNEELERLVENEEGVSLFNIVQVMQR